MSKKSDSIDFLEQARRIMDGGGVPLLTEGVVVEETSSPLLKVVEVKVEPPKVVVKVEPPKVEPPKPTPKPPEPTPNEDDDEDDEDDDDEGEGGDEEDEDESGVEREAREDVYEVPVEEGLNITESGLILPIAMITETIGIVAQKGAGKALALDTHIPTPGGWTTMGEIQAGDRIFDDQGREAVVTMVTEPMQEHPCFKVFFSDGSHIIADGEHLWLTSNYATRRSESSIRMRERQGGGRKSEKPQCQPRLFPSLVTTEEMLLSLRHGPSGDLNHAIGNTKALELPDITLPIDPYVLGYWLGNGDNARAVVTTMDVEVLRYMGSVGYEIGEPFNPSESEKSASYLVGKGPDGIPLQTLLRTLGLLHDKHVPAEYLRAGKIQRLRLLMGLVDSDGTVTKHSNMATFGSTREVLARNVAELVHSLGWTSRFKESRAMLNGKDYGPFYEVNFTPLDGRRMVVAIEPVQSVPVKCIAVDSKSRLYLAGRSMIPTHNTHTTVVFAEECLQQELPVIIIDPLGVYWGLRSSKDGESVGMTIRILGGDHGDLPLDPGSGRAIARWCIGYKKSVILDINLMRKSEQRLFVAEFAEEIYEKNKEAIHLIMDEADLFMPQRKPEPDQKRVLLAFDDIVRRGRVRGIGITVVTQRPAVLHKDILTQVGTLIVLRMMGPQDRDAIDEWFSSHADRNMRLAAINSLPGLPRGTAWVWSPGFLELFQKVKIRDRCTFDSSSTPVVGAPPRAMPNVRAEIDIGELQTELGDAVKHDPGDPRNMRLRIAELERVIEARGGEEGSSIVAMLRRRIDELEKQLIARAGRGKGTPMTVDTSLLATIVFEARSVTESNKVLTDQVMALSERFDQMMTAMAAGEEPEAPAGGAGAIEVYEKPDPASSGAGLSRQRRENDGDEDDDDEDDDEDEDEEEPPPPPKKKRKAAGRKH